MSAVLTEKDFSQHLHTKFQVKLDGQESIALELVEVKGYRPQEIEQSGMERFSVFFNGAGSYLPQGVYQLEHADLGELVIFLVPVSGDQKSFRYEAVFNYFKE